MSKGIFRKEAIEYKKHHWKGKVLLLSGTPAWLVVTLSFSFLLAFMISLIAFNFTQRIDVRGEVITLPHSVNVFSAQQGFIVNQYVKIGDIVTKGQPLYEIDTSRNTSSGNVSAVQISVIQEKIENSSTILKKTRRK